MMWCRCPSRWLHEPLTVSVVSVTGDILALTRTLLSRTTATWTIYRGKRHRPSTGLMQLRSFAGQREVIDQDGTRKEATQR